MPQRHHHPQPRNRQSAPLITRSTAQVAPAPQALVMDPRQNLTPHLVQHLQRSVGNRALAQLLGRNDPTPAPPAQSGASTLTVGPVDDRHEQEADRIATQVSTNLHTGNNSAPLRRAPASDTVAYAQGGQLDAPLAHQIQRARGSGTDLDDRVRAPMEQALGADLGGVRIHTDPRADTLNRALDAKAFTTGQDIFFGRGNFQPHTRAGQHLLAHELTHVVQQKQGVQRQVIQRYGKQNKDYVRSRSDLTDPISESQSEDPILTPQNELRHTFKRYDQPNMRFADDGTLAVSAEKGEAKEFYATDNAINAGNLDLQAVGSAVELVPSGGTSIKQKGSDKTLKKVKPGITPRNTATRLFDDDAHFGTHICIEVAQLVFGNMAASYGTQAVFEKDDGTTHTEDFTVHGKPSKEIFKLADYLAESANPNFLGINAAMSDGSAQDSAGSGYHKALAKDKLSNKARSLGFNEYAKASVGEGYATYSSTTPSGSSGGHQWGYHYAGVVAHSEDGNDQVTLENYNRESDVNKAKRAMYEKLFKDNRRAIRATVRQLQAEIAQHDQALQGLAKGTPAYRDEENDKLSKSTRVGDLAKKKKSESIAHALKEVYATVMENQGTARNTALADYTAATATDPAKRWFFHLYGSGKGQSFHEQMKQSGFFSDPLTLRVRKQ